MNLIPTIVFISFFCLVPGVPGVKYRLSTKVKPSFYSIKLRPDLDKEAFNGTVLIHIKVKDFVESIDLHSCDLHINSVLLNSEKLQYRDSDFTGSNETVHAYKFADYELLEIGRVDGNKISPGFYTVYISYWGAFSKNDTGFSKAKLIQNNEVVSYLAVTDFEPTHARRTIPCFDEPSFKAKFQLTLITPNSTYFAISNMPVIKRFVTSKGVFYKFQTSPPMSTYLLAFAVTQYTYGKLDLQTPIRGFSHKANDKSTKKVLEYVQKSLEFYSNYTEYYYPLPKLDLIEYERTQSTATENWGLITLSAGILSGNDSVYDDNQKVNIISHEIAHFWFGNLVTNHWWDDIWLQEGFAVFMALKAEQSILNNNAVKKFSNQYLEDNVYWFDERKPSAPVVNAVESPTEIRHNFNDITYVKGAAVLQMLERVLGYRRFKKAIRRYICIYAFKSASTSDFLNIVEEFKPSNTDIRGFMESYLFQNRYPVIYVTETEDSYILTQRSCRSDDAETPFEYKWTIPVTFITNINKTTTKIHWFDRDMETLKIQKQNETWIKFNYEQQGLYRVHYSEDLWNKLMTYNHALDSDDKSHLLLEAVQLYDANIIPCDNALRYLKQLSTGENLPKNFDALEIAYIKLHKLSQFDKGAFRLLLKLFNEILENAGIKKTFSSLDEDIEYNNGTVPSEKTKLCIDWIKTNLKD